MSRDDAVLSCALIYVTVQRGRAVPKNRNRSDGTSHVSVTADTQTGSISAGVASPVGRDAAHNGQCRYLLRSALSLHLHLQVFPTFSFDFKLQIPSRFSCFHLSET